MTSDKDFGELAFRLGRAVAGVLLLRQAGLNAAGKARLVVKTLADHSHAVHAGFSVLTESTLRIRSHDPSA